MAGKKGMKGENLGGRRPGAGAPVIKRTIRIGQQFAVQESDSAAVPVWRVIEVTRKHIRFESSDGHTITLLT